MEPTDKHLEERVSMLTLFDSLNLRRAPSIYDHNRSYKLEYKGPKHYDAPKSSYYVLICAFHNNSKLVPPAFISLATSLNVVLLKRGALG